MEQQLNSRLAEMIAALDGSIQSAVEVPESAGGASLDGVRALCREVSQLEFNTVSTRETSDLLWQVRARVGRLKLLIDSAAYFYAGLQSPQSSGMDYNARGEWKGHAANRLIRIRC